MRKTALLILLFCMLCMPDLIAQSYIRTASFLFSFPEGVELLEEDCGDNQEMLRCMENELIPVRSKIQAGAYHLLIVAHVSAFNYANTQVINKASRHASYIHAYILSKLAIPEESMAFYIDRSGDYRDKVHVYLVRSPLPVYANMAICYSEEDSPEVVKKEIIRYGGVPYVNLYRNGESNGYRKDVYVINDPLFDRSEVDDYRLAIPIQRTKAPVKSETPLRTVPEVPAKQQPVKQQPVKQQTVQQQPIQQQPVIQQPEEKQPKEKISRQEIQAVPRISLSTNLLYWALLSPNLTFDCYFGNAFSFHLEGVYADWQTRSSYPKTWSVWEVSPEFRYWLWGKEYGFTGHYLGVYGHLGDFDFMFYNSKGFVGSYEGGGLSYGYVFPLNRALCLELGIRAGFAHVKYDTYYYDAPAYYKDQPHKKYYLGPTGAHCSLIYRF